MQLFEATHTRLPSIVTPVIPYGVPYALAGAGGGVTWTVRAGVGSGTTVAVSDPAAPFDVDTTYTLTAGALVETGTFARQFDSDVVADTLLCSEAGRGAVWTTWEEAPLSWDPRASYAQPIARRRPVQSRPVRAGGNEWGVEFRVDLDDVETTRGVLESGRLWIAHARSRSDGGSTLPRIMLAGIDGAVSEDRWPLGRTYSFKVRELDTPSTGVPLLTFGESRSVWSSTIPTTFNGLRAAIGGA